MSFTTQMSADAIREADARRVRSVYRDCRTADVMLGVLGIAEPVNTPGLLDDAGDRMAFDERPDSYEMQ